MFNLSFACRRVPPRTGFAAETLRGRKYTDPSGWAGDPGWLYGGSINGTTITAARTSYSGWGYIASSVSSGNISHGIAGNSFNGQASTQTTAGEKLKKGGFFYKPKALDGPKSINWVNPIRPPVQFTYYYHMGPDMLKSVNEEPTQEISYAENLPFPQNNSSGLTNLDRTNNAIDVGDGLVGSFEGLAVKNNYWLGKNGKYYYGFKGRGPNRFTGSRAGALNSARNYRVASRTIILLEVGVGAYSTMEGYQLDGGRFGYNTQKAAASTAAGVALGIVSAEWGASIGAGVGAWFFGVGSVPGALVGAGIGFTFGFVGGYAGSYLGGRAVDYYHDH